MLSIGVADIDDLILNTAGAVLGYFVCRKILLIFPQVGLKMNSYRTV
ncbi:MAG: VanZ family protein [Bacteroidetes bacterium]|nr:VanZ family protein [Bacteroidota bacterium]